MFQNNIEFGNEGEKIAANYLAGNGYKIIEKKYRNDIGEIDIIAEDGDYLCFIEVKSRMGEDLGHPFEAVTKPKQKQIIRVALSYIVEEGIEDKDIRFDVVAVCVYEGPDSIELLKSAFNADDTKYHY